MSGDDETPNGPKVVHLPDKQDEFKALNEKILRNMPAMLEHQRAQAKLRRAAYLAYLEEGFTKEEALELCVK